ncbi:MAG: hypothetical protein PHH93_14250 [Prolixibacteraceae bacterium]|nr:hypothetical protein [Prolixibacteraceae bacterium]
MTKSKHKTESIYCPFMEEQIEIDKDISDLIGLLWSADFITYYCCQENDDGLIWIEFPQYYAEIFINAICSELDAQDPIFLRILGESDANSWEYSLSLRNLTNMNHATSQMDVFDNPVVSFRLSVRFPGEDYSIVLNSFRKWLKKGCSIIQDPIE